MQSYDPSEEDKSPDDFAETENASVEPRPGEGEEALGAEGGEEGSDFETDRETQQKGSRNPSVDDWGSYGAEGGGGQPTTQRPHPGEGKLNE